MTLTGICVVKRTDAGIVGSVVNEFGLHAFDMVEKGRKLKVKNVMSMMDKWYIRRVLKKDLVQLMLRLQQGQYCYKNERQHITYQFTPIANEVTQ